MILNVLYQLAIFFLSVDPLQNFTYKMHCDVRRYFYELALSMWEKEEARIHNLFYPKIQNT